MNTKTIHLIWAWLFSLLLLFPGSGDAAEKAARTRADFPSVLMYHDVRETPLNYFDVTVKDFCAHLDYLKKEGYKTLSMEEFVSILEKGQAFPEKSVLITFDDGYKGIYDYAAPELEKRGMKATFFIITDLVDTSIPHYPYITRAELKELADNPLFSIGSHTLSHPHLDELTREGQRQEIADSKRILEEWTGRKIQTLAFPCGAYNKTTLQEIQSAGYAASFAVGDRGLLHESAHYSIPRIYMGLELGKDHLDQFGDYVKRYQKMPAEIFADRWEFLPGCEIN